MLLEIFKNQNFQFFFGFLTKKFFSKHFSSVNMPDMEKIHTLKKILLDPKISFFNFLCAREPMRARSWRAHITKKCIFWLLLIHMSPILARSARATARAITKCTPIDWYDQIEVICTINHYHNSKIDEFAICWTFVENRFFRKFLIFFSKKLDFLKNCQISKEYRFINFWDMIMIYSANLFYLTMQIHSELYFDGARTCARAARISSTSNEMLFLKDFWHWSAVWARSARASARALI